MNATIVWTPARAFMAIAAAVHLPLGVAGLLVDRSFPLGSNAAEQVTDAYVFGVLKTNGWHSLAALLLGVVTLYFAVRPTNARTVALVLGIAHVGIFFSLVVRAPGTGMLAWNNADQVVHASTAIGGIVSGLLTTKIPRLEKTGGAATES